MFIHNVYVYLQNFFVVVFKHNDSQQQFKTDTALKVVESMN